MKAIRFALIAATMALASCAPRAHENIRPALVADLCEAEANLAGIIMEKRQTGAPQSEVMTTVLGHARPEVQGRLRRIVAAAYASPRAADVTETVDRFKKEQIAQCFRITR